MWPRHCLWPRRLLISIGAFVPIRHCRAVAWPCMPHRSASSVREIHSHNMRGSCPSAAAMNTRGNAHCVLGGPVPDACCCCVPAWAKRILATALSGWCADCGSLVWRIVGCTLRVAAATARRVHQQLALRATARRGGRLVGRQVWSSVDDELLLWLRRVAWLLADGLAPTSWPALSTGCAAAMMHSGCLVCSGAREFAPVAALTFTCWACAFLANALTGAVHRFCVDTASCNNTHFHVCQPTRRRVACTTNAAPPTREHNISLAAALSVRHSCCSHRCCWSFKMKAILAMLLGCLAGSASAQHSGITPQWPRPPHTQHALLSRWLVHTNTWGSLATLGEDGSPVGGVVAFSDGALDTASGRLFFYLTPMDETAQNLQARPACALTVAEAQMLPGGCGDTDPEDPTCAKISVLGDMRRVPDADAGTARAALFSRHPAMQGWPADHGFALFELHISEVHMLDWYGGMHIIPAAEYFAAQLTPAPTAAQQRPAAWRTLRGQLA